MTVIADDGTGSATNSFMLTVNPPPPGAGRFASTDGISIPLQGASTPYPSQIIVSNLCGAITSLTVTLSQFTHSYPGDVDMLLVAPDNQHAVVICSRAGDGGVAIPGYFAGANNITLTLSDAAAYALPFPYPLISTPFRPANYSSATNGGVALFPSPAPDPSFYTNTPVAMSCFNGLSPDGTWSLYVYDYAYPDSGVINAWSLMITTSTAPAKPVLTSILLTDMNEALITGTGDTDVVYTIQASTDLINWQSIGTATAGTNGVFNFQDSNIASYNSRYYRASFP